MGLAKITKVTSKGMTGKLSKSNKLAANQQVKRHKQNLMHHKDTGNYNTQAHALGFIQTSKNTVGFSVTSKPGKRKTVQFGHMNKGLDAQKGDVYEARMVGLPLPTGKELAVAGGLVGTAYALGSVNESVYNKKSGKRTK